MAKRKNKNVSADRIHAKKQLLKAKKVMNPFEIHVNREKLRVLGKEGNNDRGLPGISRAKAIQKRKHTLLKEYKELHKSNKFTDKRIGEKRGVIVDDDEDMIHTTKIKNTVRDKEDITMLQRNEFTKINPTIGAIEQFTQIESDGESSDDENKTGRLDAKFVKVAHFTDKNSKEGAKTHKEIIDQLIAESKKRKAEKQKIKEATLELTEKLDLEWKDLLPIVNVNKKSEENKTKQSKVDDYDKAVRELRFEARGTVSDRLKTEDEIAKEEKERLERLEQERQERMRGDVEKNVSKPNHRSADDLDDNLVYELEYDESANMLSYNNEGEANVEIDAEIDGKSILHNPESEARENEGENDASSEEDEELDSEDNLSDLKEDNSGSESETEAPASTEKEMNEVNNEKMNERDSEKMNEVNSEKTNEVKSESVNKVSVVEENCVEDQNLQTKIKEDLLKRKEIMEQARKELPFTFALPESYESLQKTFENQSSSHQTIIVERMIKCNHPSLAKGNKENLGLLFAYLLQYINDLFEEVPNAETIKNNFEIFNALVPQLYNLAELNPENAHHSLLEVMKEKHGEYRKKPREYPGYEILVFLRLISVLFTTSDFRHQIVTPCFVFIEQMLTKCKIKDKRGISYGLFLCTILLEYTVLSKRYLPAVINFLSGLLHMAIPKSGVKLIKVLPPFKTTSSNLVLLKNYSSNRFETLHLDSKDLLNNEISEDYKIRALYVTIKLLGEFYNNLKELSSSMEIFEPVLRYLEMIPTGSYPNDVKKSLDDLVNILKDGKANKKLNYIVMASEKPKALRLYEPKIVKVFTDGKKFKKQSREKADKDRLLHKLKKETKGALREIRKDKAFLGRVKINEKIQSDMERKEKVKRLYAEAATQQSELNTLDRAKKRKK